VKFAKEVEECHYFSPANELQGDKQASVSHDISQSSGSTQTNGVVDNSKELTLYLDSLHGNEVRIIGNSH